MAWRMNALDAALSSTSTLYTLSSYEFGGSEVRIVGTGFTYDPVSGILNGGTITSMSLVVTNGGTDTVQTVTMTGGLTASTYFAFAHAAYDLRAQTSTWGLQFPNSDSGFTFTPTLITLVMLDGTKVLIAGSGFDTNTDAGTVTSMTHVSANGLTTLHTATGLPASLATVSSSFGNDEAFYSILVQGDNVITQVSTSYFVSTDGGAGNDNLNGGALSNFGGTSLDYNTATAAVIVSLTAGTATGGAGNDTLTGNFGGISGSSFDDTLTGNGNWDNLSGKAGNDHLYGLAGDDYLNGGLGNDIMDGGADNDTADYYDYDAQTGAITTGVTVNLSIVGAQDTIGQGVDTLLNIENIDGSDLADTLTGDGNVNILYGNNGNDIIDGGADADQMYGGDGDDTYFVDDAGDQVNEFDPVGGVDTVNSNQANSVIGNYIENFNYTGNVALSLVGNAGNNVINAGSASSSMIEGKGGSDVINGGAGNDDLYGDSQFGDVAVNSGISLGVGTLAHSGSANGSLATAFDVSNSFTLTANPNVEAPTILPHVTVLATGGGVIDYYAVQINNNNANIIADIDFGFGTSNNFNGTPIFTALKLYDPNGNEAWSSTGSDTTAGAGGSTTYTDGYMSPGLYMTGLWKIAVFTYTGNYPGGVISPVANGATYELNISVAGELTTYDDTLQGNGGADRLVGGIGNDLLDGGDGLDTADYSGALQAVTLVMAAGSASGADVGSDTLISIENVIGGAGGDSLNGDANDNVFTGNGGADVLFAGAGNDTLLGGDDADTLVGNCGHLRPGERHHSMAAPATIPSYASSQMSSTAALASISLQQSTLSSGRSILAPPASSGCWPASATTTSTRRHKSVGVEVFASGGIDIITRQLQATCCGPAAAMTSSRAAAATTCSSGGLGSDSLSGGDGYDRLYVDSQRYH